MSHCPAGLGFTFVAVLYSAFSSASNDFFVSQRHDYERVGEPRADTDRGAQAAHIAASVESLPSGEEAAAEAAENTEDEVDQVAYSYSQFHVM